MQSFFFYESTDKNIKDTNINVIKWWNEQKSKKLIAQDSNVKSSESKTILCNVFIIQNKLPATLDDTIPSLESTLELMILKLMQLKEYCHE